MNKFQFANERTPYQLTMDAVYSAMETGNVPGAREALAASDCSDDERDNIKHNVLKDYGTRL